MTLLLLALMACNGLESYGILGYEFYRKQRMFISTIDFISTALRYRLVWLEIVR